MTTVKARPNTQLRQELLNVMFSKGFAGPNYNIDHVTAYAGESKGVIYLHFWDMNCQVKEGEQHYEVLYKLIKENESSN